MMEKLFKILIMKELIFYLTRLNNNHDNRRKYQKKSNKKFYYQELWKNKDEIFKIGEDCRLQIQIHLVRHWIPTVIQWIWAINKKKVIGILNLK